MSGRHSLQLTLAIFKPDLMLHPTRVQNVEKKILLEDFWIIKRKILHWSRKEAEMFYQEHKGCTIQDDPFIFRQIEYLCSDGRFFFRRLTSFMSSGPIMPLILGRDDAINHWRMLMGPTKTTIVQAYLEAQWASMADLNALCDHSAGAWSSTSAISRAKQSHPDSVRGLYGLTDTRNATHGSDSSETAEKEIKYFFPEFNQDFWFSSEAQTFQTGPVMFDESLRIHKVHVDG